MTLLILFMIAYLIVFLLTPVLIRISFKWRFLDIPSRRKVHVKATPRLGGVAVVVSFLITLFLSAYLYPAFWEDFSQRAYGILLASLLILAVGLWDDIAGLKPITKLLAQITIAMILCYFGFSIKVFTNPFGGGEIQLPAPLIMLLTTFWIVGMINAINLIDGLDGLASGIVFFSSISLILVGFYLNTVVPVILLIILAGATLAFLHYNFPPAKIFLGDTGSMFLGMVLAVSALAGFQYKVVTTVALLIPVCALVIPIYDTALAMWRRFLKRSSIFIADKKHLHHRFLQLGLTQKDVVLGFYIATIYFGVIAFLFVLIPNEYALLLLFLLWMGLFAGIRTVAFIERKLKLTHLLKLRLKKK
ncbi:MAG: MraY family glycosyltransferase [Candidatus Omnitrophota bacterium]